MKKFFPKIHNITTTIIIIIILIFFSFIITHCFTSLLLNIYFKLTKVAFIDNLEQLIEEDQFYIASMKETFDSLEYYELIDESKIEVMRKRKDKYDKITELNMQISLFDERVFNDMIGGKAIILETGFRIDFFVEFFKRDSDLFTISQNKYLQYLFGYIIYKRSPIVKQQIYGCVYLKHIHYHARDLLGFYEFARGIF